MLDHTDSENFSSISGEEELGSSTKVDLDDNEYFVWLNQAVCRGYPDIKLQGKGE